MPPRPFHYLLLTGLVALLCLPSLGAPSLWDMDEGVNAECTREMMETGTWIVPTYNYDLRTAKPVMLYWLQRASYNLFGISEWSARLPSVMAALATVLLVYELGRSMFGANAGLLAGMALTSCIEFVKLAHAATPDATFIFFTVFTLASFWFGQRDGGRLWFVPTAIAAALAVLTKGPAGVALPGLVILLFLLWNRELHRLWDRRLIWAGLAFLLVAAPWYAFVATETRGAYIRAFFGNENVNRFLSPMENHRGPVVYYIGAIIIFFAPWSVALGPTLWHAVKSRNDATAGRAQRFLLLWWVTYLTFFSCAATKLPNYIAPVYPALALLTANFLRRWASHAIPVRSGTLFAAGAGLLAMGLVVGIGVLIVSGVWHVPVNGLRILPDLAPWAALGLIPIAGMFAASIFALRTQRSYAVQMLAVVAVLFVGLLAAFPIQIVDAAKAPRSLVTISGACQPERDIRIASLDYSQESVTFYAQRRVERLRSIDAATEFLALPRPGYLFVPAAVWESFADRVGPCCVAARQYDFYRNAEILVVTTDGAGP